MSLKAVSTYAAAGGAIVTSVSGTANRITSTGGTTPVIDISAAYVGQTSLTTVGTLTTGATGAGFTIALGSSTVTGTVAPINGGLGANESAATGVVQFSGGTSSVSTALANGTTATTQAALTNNTTVATTGYVDGAVSAGDAFTKITSGTNTTATMVVGTGASLAASGSGTIAATTVVTNANLTGPITSVGNTTSVASNIALPGNPTTTTQTPLTNNTTIATTAYTDAAVMTAINGLYWHASVGYASTANQVAVNVSGVLTYASTGVDTVDGHTLVLNDNVLLKDQITTADNGVYVVTTAGALGVAGVLTRRSDYNTAVEVNPGDTFYVVHGTVNTNTAWVETATVTTINTDPITFVQVAGPGSYVAGTGLTLTGNSFSVNASQTQITSVGALSAGSLAAGFTPVTPAIGGTGLATLTANAVMLGAGTSSVAFATIGTAGRLFIDQGAVTNPAFEVMSGDATLAANGAITVSTIGGVAAVTTTGTQTLTNKRVTHRVLNPAYSATPTINTDNYDVYRVTAMSGAITSMTTNLTGTPVDGDSFIFMFTDNGSPRAITWGSSFEASTVALPTTTSASALLTTGFRWNVSNNKWTCVAVA